MKFYGHADLNRNQLQNAALQGLSNFPENPVVGMLAFVHSIVYICVSAGALPVWVPMTREITAYTHTQGTALTTWVITHNLKTTSVSVQIYDNSNRVIIPNEIETHNINTCSVTFQSAQAGRAVVVSGHFDGGVRPTYSFTHEQTTSLASWVIVHNLGYYPIVRIFIGNNEVQPQSIVHDTTNQVTITFSSPQVGFARLI